MKKIMQIVVWLYCIAWSASAQPYVDPIQIRFTYAFQNKTGEATPFTHLWVGSDLPIKLKDRTYQLLSPYYENWALDSAGTDNILPTVHSIAFPMGFIIPLRNPKWTMNLMPIVRTNGEKLFGEKTFQIGGVAFWSYEKAPGKKIRMGAYANSDFFGFFFMPLLGADWRIDKRNYIFGLLPGRLTYEHQFSKCLYGGSTFRAITNSYRFENGEYVRLDDNQISLYLDAYVAKHICLTLEPGYGIMRKLRTGIDHKNYITDRNWGDGPFIKLSASWRIRFAE
ncbi:MAG TPA: hypothetical protein VLC98_10845 [Phnomibacter sp.]|nr:hypothetical protein [Phnomibacter sp.]